MRTSPHLLRTVESLVQERSGIDLSGKEDLIRSRLIRRLDELGLESGNEYVRLIREDETGGELRQFLDALSTNVTSFFRTPHHFELLARRVRELLARGQRSFRIWSAGCSTGEEPYSIAMVLEEVFAERSIDWRILATDLSTAALGVAQAGRYAEEAVDVVEPAERARSFEVVDDGDVRRYRVRDRYRHHILFRRLNLAETPFPLRGPHDAIFCRNVMIYFDDRLRERILDEFARLMAPGGLVFVGASESLVGLRTRLARAGPAAYELAESRP